MIAGIMLFFWHLFRGEWDPAYKFGYASHQVMSVDSLILLIVGAAFYFWGKRRHQRRNAERESVGH